VVVKEEAGCFVLLKRLRTDPDSTEPICYYCVVEGIVFQCPRVDEYLKSRLERLNKHLTEAIDCIKQELETGYPKASPWKIVSEQKKKTSHFDYSVFYEETPQAGAFD